MEQPLWRILLCLLAGIGLIVLLTARFRVHAFFALLLSCVVVGTGLGMPVEEILTTAKKGFGHIMSSLGILLVLGTSLGVALEKTGCTAVMAEQILHRLGKKRAPLAMNVTGFVVGLPIFCDSGYMVLSGLNNSLAAKLRLPMAVMAGSLATGLYSVHCLIPPHPGAAAAAGILQVPVGKLMLTGILLAIPVSVVGWLWVRWAGRTEAPAAPVEENKTPAALPGVWASFLPVLIPLLLISLHAFLPEKTPGRFLGNPETALFIGLLLALFAGRKNIGPRLAPLLAESVEKAGSILVIIGAGGAFGAILSASGIGEAISSNVSLEAWGLFFPFLLTALLKTAQGSSTVAIITAASLLAPLLPALGLNAGNGPLLAVLAMGAGSLCISHANDAYFWVISKFAGLDTRTMLKVYSMATLLMGLTAFAGAWLLSLWLR